MEKKNQQLEERFSFPFSKRGRFFNPHQRGVPRKFRHLFLWYLGYYKDRIAFEKAPSDFIYPKGEQLPLDAAKPTVTWVNHSTFLIQIGGSHLLTDPIWSNR
ncbi:MAG: hypothetical protein JSR80_01980, partial [Verrucomicrobia bacterium]|nr:hypothetical protein [Verrucomicrobiota bacterium]